MNRKFYIWGEVTGYAIVFVACVALYIFAGWDFWQYEQGKQWGATTHNLQPIDAMPKEIFKRPGGDEAHGQIDVPVSESVHPVER